MVLRKEMSSVFWFSFEESHVSVKVHNGKRMSCICWTYGSLDVQAPFPLPLPHPCCLLLLDSDGVQLTKYGIQITIFTRYIVYILIIMPRVQMYVEILCVSYNKLSYWILSLHCCSCPRTSPSVRTVQRMLSWRSFWTESWIRAPPRVTKPCREGRGPGHPWVSRLFKAQFCGHHVSLAVRPT